MAAKQPLPVTNLLLSTRGGGRETNGSRDRLFALIYDDLRRLAAVLMRREAPGHTLRPTALVHELYLRIVDDTRVDLSDRARFLGLAARAMRQILVDHARRRGAVRRGGGWRRVTLSNSLTRSRDVDLDMLALEEAMVRLGSEDARAAEVAEMRLFADMRMAEIASVLGVSERTAAGDWALARRFLARQLQ